MSEQNTRTEVAALGEFGLIDRLASRVVRHRTDTLLGIGDDAAVIDPAGNRVLVSTDLLAEGIHFDLRYTPLKHLGYKAVVVNLSDIAAMNAVPTQVVVSVALSNRISVEALDELYAGINAACANYKVDLVGGDTTSSRAGLIINVTVIGMARPEDIVFRSGVLPNQVICVTGDLGAAYMGLQLLEREKAAYLSANNPEAEFAPQFADEYTYLLERQLKPEARTDVVHELREKGVKPTGMIDISDGLSSELLHLSKQSNVGVAIYADKLPIENPTKLAASEFNLSPTTAALNGGEDYELLICFAQDDFEKVRKLDLFTPIGITRPMEAGNVLVSGEHVIPLTAQGWQHNF